jgi:hypothetical protein
MNQTNLNAGYDLATLFLGEMTMGTWPTMFSRVSLKIEAVKYGHDSHGNQTQEILRWRRPAALATDPSPHQRGRPMSVNPQLSGNNKY